MKSKPDTKYPWKLVVLLGSNCLLSCTIMYSFSTYLPHLVYSLGYPWREGVYHVGVINSIFIVAGGVGTLTLGLPLTKHSQKVCLLVTTTLQGVFMLSLGFTNSLVMLYFVLFLQEPSIGVNCTKAILNKLCNENNQGNIISQAFSGPVVASLSLGPTLSGFFGFPAERYGSIFAKSGLFDRYPTFLVNLLYGLCLL